MGGISFGDHPLALATIDALEISSSACSEGPLGTSGILLGIIAADSSGAWEEIQLKTAFTTPAQAAALDREEPRGSSSWRGVPLTAPAARALRCARQIANAYEMTTVPAAVLALGLLADPSNGAVRALCTESGTAHGELIELVQDAALGTRLERLDTVLREPTSWEPTEHAGVMSSASTSSTGEFTSTQRRAISYAHGRDARDRKRQTTPTADVKRPHPAPVLETETESSRAGGVGFRVGTFIGAVIVSALAGLPFALALAFALMLQQGAARARKRSRLRGLLAPAAAVTLVAAVVLAASGRARFSEDLNALRDLRRARAAIAQGNDALATRELGSATLLENESVTINTLSACVDWSLGFKDYATAEAQFAINSGYSPGEETTYNGRDCFLDTLPFAGLSIMHVSPLPVLIFPLPDRTDATGVQFLQLAAQTRTTYPVEAMVALGCLADRYDFRMTAAYLFTLGLDENVVEGKGALPSARLRQCLSSTSVHSHYKYFVDPQTSYEVYVPTDMARRIPSPSKPRPPAGVCWARFPATQPCNTDD
jgi:hypothetical protein